MNNMILGAAIAAALVGFLICINVSWRREQARRVLLPQDEQDRIKREQDAVAQIFSF